MYDNITVEGGENLNPELVEDMRVAVGDLAERFAKIDALEEVAKTEFEVGESVIAVNIAPLPGNVIAPPLKEGTIYPVLGVHTCGCGNKHIDVGLVSRYEYVSCYNCEEHLPNGNRIHWCHPSRLVKQNV